jgi:polyphosphate glucokinase
MHVLGIDIGGSAFKGAPVDVKSGKLLADRYAVAIPAPCPVADGLGAARAIVRHFKWRGRVGIGFPGIIQDGHIGAVGNLGNWWQETDGTALFGKATGCKVKLLNDADAAGLAEMRFGAGRGQKGTVLMLTMGTGIGSALFHRGELFPNIEFGHIPWKGKPIERYSSALVKTKLDLGWKEWSERVNVFLAVAERLCAPELIIIGGGVSRRSHEWFKYLKSKARIVPAKLENDAGIVGAAAGGV